MSSTLTAGKPVIDAIKIAYVAKKSVLLEGTHGIGKSQIMEQAAKEMEIDFIVRDLSLMEPPDLLGLPQIVNGRTRYAQPDFLPKDGNGILMFEELNRAEKYMMSPCLQLLTARILNDYTLPPGWSMAAAINPSEGDEYDVNELDPALLSRFIRIGMRASSTEWLKWAFDHEVHPAVTRYVKNTKGVFGSSNPRSWTYVSDTLKAVEACGKVDKAVLTALVCGSVDNTHAAAFLETYQGTGANVPTADEILRNYKRTGAVIRSWKTPKNTDKFSACAHAVRTALQDADLCVEIAGSKVLSKALADFIKDLPADLGKQVSAGAKAGGALT